MAISPITIIRGDTLKLRFRFRDADTLLPIDITDWKLYLTFKPDVNLPDASSSAIQEIYDLSVADPLFLKVISVTPAAGDLTIRLGPEKTKLFLPTRKYQWDLQRVEPITEDTGVGGILLRDHNVTTYATGVATVSADVTLTYLQGTLDAVYP